MTVAEGAEPAAASPRPARRAALGAMALSVANMLRMGVQLAMLPLLARLVGPSEYGLVALAVPFILFCNMLADGGMGQALARRQDATPALESTVFWLAGALGGALALIACLAAWPISVVLHQPRLVWLILALSPILVMSGFTAAANARVIRQGRFGIFAGGDFLSTAAAAGVALWAALNGAGAWSLVAQQLTLWSVKFAWVNLRARPAIFAGVRLGEVRELVRFGLHAIGANLSDFVARNADNIIIGGTLGASAVGYYAMAYQIVRVPDLVLSGPLYLYVFTAVARAAHDGSRGAAAELAASALRLTSTALAPVFVGLALIAPPAVSLVLGEKWTPATPVLVHLSAAGFGFAHCLVMGAILMALGRSHLQLRLAMLSAATTIATVAATARLGVATASLAVGIAVVCVATTYLVVLARDLKVPTLRLAAALAPALGSAGLMAAALLAVRPMLTHQPQIVQLGALVGLGGLVYGGSMLAIGRKRLVADARTFARAHA